MTDSKTLRDVARQVDELADQVSRIGQGALATDLWKATELLREEKGLPIIARTLQSQEGMCTPGSDVLVRAGVLVNTVLSLRERARTSEGVHAQFDKVSALLDEMAKGDNPVANKLRAARRYVSGAREAHVDEETRRTAQIRSTLNEGNAIKKGLHMIERAVIEGHSDSTIMFAVSQLRRHLGYE